MAIYHVPTTKQQTRVRLHNDRAWRKASAAYLQQYPFCVLCLVRGDINRGADEMPSMRQRNLVVDHITPHRGDADLFWDMDNWQTLCRMPCHDVDKQRHEQANKTAAQWFAMLRHDAKQHSDEACLSLLPDHIADGIWPMGHQGRGGCNATIPSR